MRLLATCWAIALTSSSRASAPSTCSGNASRAERSSRVAGAWRDSPSEVAICASTNMAARCDAVKAADFSRSTVRRICCEPACSAVSEPIEIRVAPTASARCSASDDAVIVMARSGGKTYSSQALQRAEAVGATRISIGSLTAEHAGSQQILRTVEREKSAAFTASHLAAMFVLAQIATSLGESRQAPATRELRSALEALPEQVEGALAREEEVNAIAHQVANKRIYAVGGGPNEASAIEAVIKVREAAQGWIDGLAIEQFLHGPLVAVNADDAAVVVHVAGTASARTQGIARVLEAVGARVWVIGQRIESMDAFELPNVPELVSPLLTVVPVQMLAYHMAVVRGINPDVFRRDDPRYAAALGLLKL